MKVGEQQRAQEALAIGDVPKAIEIWTQCAKEGVSPDQLSEWIILVFKLYYFKDAEKLARLLLDHPEANASNLQGIAKLFFEVGRFKFTAELMSRVVCLKKHDPSVIELLASCLERSGQVHEATVQIDRALMLNPNHARSVRMKAHLERRGSHFLDAKQRLEKQLSEHPSDDDWILQYELASILDRLGDFKGAMEILLSAKKQLEQMVPKKESELMSERRWEVTQLLTIDRINHWRTLQSENTSKREICALAGFPRSGTTLLENILATDSHCVATDETGILHALFEQPLILDADSAESSREELDSFDVEDIEAGVAEYFRCTEEFIGESTSGRCLLEKEPLLTESLSVPLMLFPEMKVIMPLRDPRDVIISYFFTFVPTGIIAAPAIELGEACRYYAKVMRHWLFIKKILPKNQWIESRYEDLLANPEKQTRKIAHFLNLEWSEEMLNHHKNLGGRTVSTPTYDDVSKPLYTRSLERWRNYEQWLNPHLHHLEPYIKAFGYS